MNQEKVATFLKELRQEKNYTQQQLADKIYIDRGAISKWERGINFPSTELLLKLSNIYNVTVNEILYGERKNKKNSEEIDNISLKIIDQSNKKILIFKFLCIATFIIIFALLGLFFINNYNSVKIYQISSDKQEFNINRGILILSREELYLKIGIIKSNKEYDSYSLYYVNNDEQIILSKDSNKDIIYINKFGDESMFSYKKSKEIINNLYIDLYLNNTIVETIKLNSYQIYQNNKFIYKDSEIKNNYNYNIEDNISQNILEQGYKYQSDDNSYIKEESNNGKKYKISYFPELKILNILIDEEKIYKYYLDYNELSIQYNNEQYEYNIEKEVCNNKLCNNEEIKIIKEKYIQNIKKS